MERCQTYWWVLWTSHIRDGFLRGSVVKGLPASAGDAEAWVRPLGQEDPPEEEMAPHSSILAWRIPWTEEAGGLPSMGHRVRHSEDTGSDAGASDGASSRSVFLHAGDHPGSMYVTLSSGSGFGSNWHTLSSVFLENRWYALLVLNTPQGCLLVKWINLSNSLPFGGFCQAIGGGT